MDVYALLRLERVEDPNDSNRQIYLNPSVTNVVSYDFE